MPATEIPLASGGSPTVNRAESMAYPRTNSFLSKLQWYLRQNSKMVLIGLAAVVTILFITSDFVDDTGVATSSLRSFHQSTPFSGAAAKGYFRPEDAVVSGNVFKFAAVTDLDQLSKIDGSKPAFRSYVQPGTITHDPKTNTYSLDLEPTRELITKHNEAGRGAEFSELQIFNNRLMTFDDRTGDVFEIRNHKDGMSSYVVPRLVITEGDGETDKGMKWEWATVKNGELYMGSMGKEYTNPNGSIANTNNLWVTIVNQNGGYRRVDWVKQFTFVREQLGAQSPGYVIHEAINWSPKMRKWVFMPRRISSEAYDDVKDELRGSNKAVLVDEGFTTAKVVDINMASKDGLHGFSSFAFVPNTNDKHVLALRSVEENCAGDLDVCKQRSYLVVFDVTTGEVLLDEQKIPEDMKFEGVEFVDMFAKP